VSPVVLIDDHLHLRTLLDDEPEGLRSGDVRLATTGLWYHRLCRALNDTAVLGSMSRQLGVPTDDVASAAVAAVVDLPEDIELRSLRDLGWPMGAVVASGVRLNLLSLEAIAAAEALEADICLAPADENPPLLAVARQRGIEVRIVR
jgi:hypothetical protein